MRAWGDGRLVVLAGAGISAVPPSDLPSWWHFNVAVLDGVRELTKRSYDFAAETVTELDALALDDVGVAQFSQVVTECFAGPSWFDFLGHLDGSTPSACHEALALLAKEGRLAAVVTTNFDTLIERAFRDLGVPLDVYVPGEDRVPPADLEDAGPCRLVKVHGSVTENSSMIDLASQKARGLPVPLRAWLSRVFAEHPLLVAGFSGADLSLGDDYFGLGAALPRMPWMRWVTRGGRPPLPAAAAAVATAPKGSFVEGELPAVLAEVDLRVPSPRAAPAGEQVRPREWVDEWLSGPAVSPEGCAALAARLLDIGGRELAATSIRDEVRSVIEEKLATGLTFLEMLPVGLALAQFGSDLVRTDPQQALADLTRARKIAELFLAEMGDRLDETARIEQSDNAAGVLLNIALAHVAMSEPDEAERAIADARPRVEALPLARAAEHRARVFYAGGLICHLRGRNRQALLDWRQASLLAGWSGATDIALAIAENRWRTLAALGEVDLAKLVHAEAERLRAMVPGVQSTGASFDLEWAADGRRAVFDTLIGRLDDEVRLGGGRLDEALYSAWAASADAPELRDRLRQALSLIEPGALDGMEPRQRALVAIARHELEEGDDVSLLDPAPTALSEWLFATLRDERPATIPEARLVLHPDLREAIVWLARRWAQAGIRRQREENWPEAERQFVVGGCAFGLAGERAEAVRALLYSVDSTARLKRYDDAERLLSWLGLGSGPESTADVLSRHVKMLAYRVSSDEMDAKEAVDLARPLRLRLERLEGVDETVGAGLLAAGSLHYFAGEREEAIELTTRAAELLSDEEDKRAALFNLRQMSSAPDSDADDEFAGLGQS